MMWLVLKNLHEDTLLHEITTDITVWFCLANAESVTFADRIHSRVFAKNTIMGPVNTQKETKTKTELKLSLQSEASSSI